ncbi:hypothetical protein [Streptomyces sp. NPDC048106]|uniref:hypothetical protein n=1 Tax=Streptomyces sp. NPDC048106 TaxID=3155750 RepID=UPI0034513D5F
MITAGRLAAPPVVSRSHLSAEQQAEKFPPRPSAAHWPAAEMDRDEVPRMWVEATPRQEDPRNHDFRRRGLTLMLDWLAEQPGRTWHERWHASGADADGEQWAAGPARWLEQHGKSSRTRLETMTSSLVVMIGADVVRPSLHWLLTGGKKRKLARNMIRARDTEGFARLDDFCRADDGISDMDRRAALFRTAVIIAAKGGTVADIVVGDLLEVLEVEAGLRGQRRSGSATFRALRETGVFGVGVPTLREIRSIGQRPVEESSTATRSAAVRSAICWWSTSKNASPPSTTERCAARPTSWSNASSCTTRRTISAGSSSPTRSSTACPRTSPRSSPGTRT